MSIGAINGGVNLYGITDQEGSYILSGAGAEVIPYRAYSNLVIGANTLTNWYGFNSTLASKTGGTLTNAYSFYANSPTAATNNFAFYSAGAAKSVFGGNVGIGVTPYAWTTASGYKSLDMPYACFYNFNGGAGVAQNATLTSTGWNYRDTLSAQRYEQHNGTHAWYSASSGTSGSPITFTQAMTLAASGNLLINTTTDDGVSKLQVNGSIITDTVLAVKGALTVHATSAGIFEFNSNKVSIRAYGATSGTGFITFNTGGGGGSADAERMRIDSNGNVAIGTTTSHYATSGRTVLNINGSTSSILGLQNGNDTAGYLYADSGNFIVSTEDSRTLSLIVTGAAAMTFGTSGTERMRIDSNGNVAIGTSSPISKLSNTATNIADGNGLTPGTSAIQWITGVQGYVAAFSNTGFGNQFANGLLVETVGTSNDADAIVNFESGGVNRLKLTGAGNLGIGTTTTPTEKLDVVGNAKVSGTLSAGGAITAANIFTGYQWAFTIAATNTTACTIRSDTYNTSLCSSSAFYARNALSTSLGTTRTGFDTYLVCVYMKAGTNWEIVYPDIVIESGGIVTITFAANQSNNIFKVVMV